MKKRYNRSQLILQLARRLGIRDPRAVLSVAAQEGLSGGVGDSGTSFGPFQLHRGGALPRNVINPQSWAWANPGLIYALSRIKSVSGNLSGPAAISAIVNRFERPANPGAEIQKAINYYNRNGGGGSVAGGVPPGVQAPPGDTLSPDRRLLLQTILNRGSIADALPDILAARTPPEAPVSPSQPLPGGGQGFGTPAELFYRNMALKGGNPIGTVPGHFNHVHAAYTNPQAVLAAIALARRLGLNVGENPYVTGHLETGGHAAHSYHYRTFPGKYNGRRLGEAIDVSGNPNSMMRFYRSLARRR